MASPVPATTATGSRTAKEGGRLPAAPSQPNTGSNGMPTAKGTHDQAVPLKTEVVAVPDREDDGGQRDRPRRPTGR